MGRQAISSPFSTRVRSAVQRNTQCSVRPLYARNCTPSSTSLYKATCQTREREPQGARRAANSTPGRAGLCLRTAGGSAPCGGVTAVSRADQSGGGRAGARPRGAEPALAARRTSGAHSWVGARGVRASRFPAGHGAADVASGRRGGSGRLPGVPEVRRGPRGARRSAAWARNPFPGRAVGEASVDFELRRSISKYRNDTQFCATVRGCLRGPRY